MNDLFSEIHINLSKGDSQKVISLVKKALEANIPIKDILDKGLLLGMESVGKEFKANRIFIPEVLISAKAVHAGLEILKPYFKKENLQPKAKIIIGTIKGDLHDIGKNLVSMMLVGAGYEVFDLGVDVDKEKFLEKITQDNIKIIGISCLISTALKNTEEAIKFLKENSKIDNLKIMVGGAAVTENFAISAGADAYGEDASVSIDLANNFIKELNLKITE